ncbi:hypothetical protein SCOR_19025 [Sulfidibacter corallicola]|uniref:Uncharacterized protein n=1 Tax=Sulfidibacter corallicola TaxID=2818388 RepID=A0A8A4TWA8_SULCO|nr:hypothetical protein [Sulfidibacter corallicola]QTD53458.1 hypothetical protein J3U87_13470 [Sulfidibacter corallicola]
MSKDVQHAISALQNKVLVNLEEFASLRGSEMIQEIYFLVLGFNYYDQRYPDNFFASPISSTSNMSSTEQQVFDFEIDSDQRVKPGEAKALKFDNHHKVGEKRKLLGETTRYNNSILDFFYAWTSPVYQVVKERVHQFPHGLPLFYGTPDQVASIYLAAFQINPESGSAPEDAYKGISDRLDEASKFHPKTVRQDLHDAVKAMQEIDFIRKQREVEPTMFRSLAQTKHDQRRIEVKFEQVRKAFSRLIKVYENLAIEANHKIRYTNVFTIREEEHWLEGGYTDWGDQRIALKINVDVS